MIKPLLLLVDDEPLLIEVLEASLIEAGFDVLIASGGDQAIEHLEADAERFKGVLTDVRLGSGPSGWDIAHRTRELVPTMPIIYISGDSAHDWSSKGVPNSIMLSKPFAMAQITTAIAQLINAQPPPRESFDAADVALPSSSDDKARLGLDARHGRGQA
jgi:DNA-binding response OmpR family regulator